MGSPTSEKERFSNEGTQREVEIEAFYLSQYEVTFDQLDACVKANGCKHKPEDRGWGRGKRPVIDVNWDDVQEYLKMDSSQYRQGLPASVRSRMGVCRPRRQHPRFLVG